MESARLAFIGCLFLSIGASSACAQSTAAEDPPQYGTPFAEVPDTRDINLYQVNIRAFSAAGDLAGVTLRLDEIADVGTNVIYLMPIFPVGEDSRSMVSTSTSPYSIKDFSTVGAEFGGLEDLRTLVDGAHERGMAVILDFVVNQTSWDHPWITENPDWYLQDEGGVIQELDPFPDVAALDLSNQDMRAALSEALRYWVFAANVDGFRFDYANNPPLEFWEQINGDLRSIDSRELILFAEGDRLENFDVGFDLNFGDKWYYDAIRPISTGAPASAIGNTSDIEYTNAGAEQQVVRYTGNHDTSADGTPIEVFGGTDGVMANFVVSAYLRGVPFLYGGQEVAFEQRIPFPWDSVKIDWNQNPDVTAEFKQVLDFRTGSTAIRRGDATDLSNDDVVAFSKVADGETVVVLANLRDGEAEYEIPASLAGTYNDAFSGVSVTLLENQTLSLAGFEYQVLFTATGSPSPPATGTGVEGIEDPVGVEDAVVVEDAEDAEGVEGVEGAVVEGAVIVEGSEGVGVEDAEGVESVTGEAAAEIVGADMSNTCVRIRNRWLDAYLYDEGDQATYGTIVDERAEWERITVDGYLAFRNKATKDFLTIENELGYVEATGGDASFWSAQWALQDYDGYQRLQNRWRSDRYLNIEEQLGYAQATAGQFIGSYSTHWELEAACE